jgi:AcrR family transcriptional regulator
VLEPLADRCPRELPLFRDRRERRDAALNRRRILDAARAVLDAEGPGGVTMDAVAVAAGVGKGTVFRRFGDRAGLMAELINDYMRDFQDRFLTGPPPLGPGAPACERLAAFTTALIALQREHLPIALVSEFRAADTPTGAYGVLRLHAAALIREINPGLDADVLASMILGAIAPPVLSQLASDPDAIAGSLAILLSGIPHGEAPSEARTAPPIQ